MQSTTIAKGILKALAIACATVLFFVFLYKVQSVIAYLIIASVIALIGRPLVGILLVRLKLPNILAVVLTMFAISGLAAGIIALIVPLLTEQGKNLYMLDIGSIQAEFDKLYSTLSEYFGTTKKVVEDIAEGVEIEKKVVEGLDKKVVPTFLNAFLEVLGTLGVGLFSVLFITFFFLKDRKMIQRIILTLVPDSYRDRTLVALSQIKNLLSRYFVGLLLQMFILFSIYSVTLLLVGVENAIIIAFMCALFNIIPYVGPIIGAIVMAMLTMTSNIDLDFSTVVLPKVGYVLIGVAIGQLIDNFFSQPFIFSSSVRSHPLEIFLIILMAGLLFGIVGMMVAVPAYTVFKVILRAFVSNNRIVTALTKNM